MLQILTSIFLLQAAVYSCRENSFGTTTIYVSYSEDRDEGHPVRISNCIEETDDTENAIWLWTDLDEELDVLKKGAISNLKNLKHLRLRENEINAIQPGAFKNLENLESLVLTDNDLTEIKQGVFSSLQVKYLFLDDNEIESIDIGAFNHMPRLAKLNLEGNKIEFWYRDYFKNTPNIKWLFLSSNLLRTLPGRAFQNLPNLQVLQLSNNDIETIHSTAFEGLQSLKELDLSKNLIKKLPENVFHPLRNAEYLHLNGNNLTYLAQKVMNDMALFTSVTLHSNPWQCGCLKIIKSWAIGSNIAIDEFYTDCIIKSNPSCGNIRSDVLECVENVDDDYYEEFNSNYRYPDQDC